MTTSASVQPDYLVDETLHFLASVLKASWAVFYWIDPNQRMVFGESVGTLHRLLDEYRGGKDELDPWLARRMIGQGERIGVLSRAPVVNPTTLHQYREFLAEFDVIETVDFLLWDEAGAFAGVGLGKVQSDPPLSIDQPDLASIHRYVESSLRMHSLVRERRIEANLRRRGLTVRELEVVALVREGASNAQIASIMEIGLATVKTYVISIFDKLGVSSRTGLAAHARQLEESSLAGGGRGGSHVN